ncbi:TonB-dependent receptor [Phenylobacterium sp.]|uniref:TonB-dependent receptor n=1 Tax=Phenylobacterium sp. TaxID=1871053 RepID=UPI00286B404A|nr:TonB-dependent receptor [Phenylobacterium sp.]
MHETMTADAGASVTANLRRVRRRTGWLASTILGAGIALSLAPAALAQDGAAAEVGEVIVTANRRAQDVTTIPYNISAVSGDQLARSGVASLEDLSRQIPNLNISSSGDRYLVARVPVIRGLNASSTVRTSALGQPAVATYLGNVEVLGYFPLDDVERVEVLRGPQGTLYGAGALGGAVRMIPSEPSPGGFSGKVTASAGHVGHSDEMDRSLAGVLNLPVSDTLTLRVSGKESYSAGFIDNLNVIRQPQNLGPPILAAPGAITTSGAVYSTNEDANYSRASAARLALLWRPTEALEVTLAFNYADYQGEGGPIANPSYPGGANPLDARVTYPATGDYSAILNTREPFKRVSRMTSADVSYDLGFATVSTTTSYLDTAGRTLTDSTFGYLALPPVLHPYYMGNPRNPRFVAQSDRQDGDETFVQEVRLVSEASESVEYTFGAYYAKKQQIDTWHIYMPGAAQQAQASGGFPVITDGVGRAVILNGDSTFVDKAVFGELTWHVTPRWQITGGGRLFRQTFTRSVQNDIPPFALSETASAAFSVSDHLLKLNSSYEFAERHNAYATFSQGFRRGGANAFALSGFLAEPRSLLTYQADTVDNYEVGLKGRFASGWSYTADLFYDDWKDPQIDTSTPANAWPVVVNGAKARSKGFELEVGGALTDRLSLTGGYAYADAAISQSFCIPAGDGGGGILACGIRGDKGTRLPGAPRHSGSVTLNYDQELANDDRLRVTLNANYKGSVFSNLPSPTAPSVTFDSYWMVNATASYAHGPWRASIYGRNLFDERAVLGVTTKTNAVVGLLNRTETIAPPRQVGLTVQYEF